jgi:hypothetical protein
MFISIRPVRNRYAFVLGEQPQDDPGMFFDSSRHAHLVAGLSPTYVSFGEAHAFGMRLLEQQPSHVAARRGVFVCHASREDAEADTVAHYDALLDLISQRFADACSAASTQKETKQKLELLQPLEEELSGVESYLESVLQEIQSDSFREQMQRTLLGIRRLQSRLAHRLDRLRPSELPEEPSAPSAEPLAPTAAALSRRAECQDLSFAVPLLRAFAEKAMQGLSALHPEIYLHDIEQDAEGGQYFMHLHEPGGPVCILRCNAHLLLNGVLPGRHLLPHSGYHHRRFWKRYWQPVVYQVGHILLEPDVLALSRHPRSRSFHMAAFRLHTTGENDLRLSVSLSPTDGCWRLSASDAPLHLAHRLTEQSDWKGAMVRVTRPDLPSYHGRTGTVLRVVPRSDYRDVLVDMGRGLDEVMFTDHDLEVVDPSPGKVAHRAI